MPPDSGGRDAILDTSAKLFSQHGYKEVSIRDIAQACGMTNAALYYHFKNKEDLFLAMLQRDHEKTLAALRDSGQWSRRFARRPEAAGGVLRRDHLRAPPVVSNAVARSAQRRRGARPQIVWRDAHAASCARWKSAWRRRRPTARFKPVTRASTRACCTA